MSRKLKKIKDLNQQAWDLCKKDGPQALELAQKVQAMLANCPEAGLIDEAECLRTQAYCLDMLSQPGQALPIGLQADHLAEQIGDYSLTGSIKSILGRIYWHVDDFPSAMDYYLGGLKLIQIDNHPDLEISLINGLGMVQYGLENYPAALEYFKTCLEKAGPDDVIGRADANNNIAYILHLLGRDQEALEYGLAGLALFNQQGTYVGKLHTLHTVGSIHLTLGNYDKSMTYLQEGLDLSRHNNSQLLELTYVLEINRILQVQGEIDEAEKELLLALTTAEGINSLTNISIIHERLVDIYEEKRDYQSALAHLKGFHATYKKIFNEKSDRRVKNLEILHKVEQSRNQAELYRVLAGTDSLTKLFNRRYFYETAEDILLKARVDKGHLAILMLDIDHFKTVNDTYGHKVGDEVLSSVAGVLKKSLRQEDIAARYGGEEFIILLMNPIVENCLHIADRIRLAIAKHTIRIGEFDLSVTVSLGLVCFKPEQPLTLDELINRADQAMYQAKNLGRNRVQVWEQIG